MELHQASADPLTKQLDSGGSRSVSATPARPAARQIGPVCSYRLSARPGSLHARLRKWTTAVAASNRGTPSTPFIERERAMGFVVDERAGRLRPACCKSRAGACARSWKSAGLPKRRWSMRCCRYARNCGCQATAVGWGPAVRWKRRPNACVWDISSRARNARLHTWIATRSLSTFAVGTGRNWPALAGRMPLILPTVDYHAWPRLVADWTGIPVGRHGPQRDRHVCSCHEWLGQARDRPDHAWR